MELPQNYFLRKQTKLFNKNSDLFGFVLGTHKALQQFKSQVNHYLLRSSMNDLPGSMFEIFKYLRYNQTKHHEQDRCRSKAVI